MCITFLFTNPGDSCEPNSIKYKLILINNRDEFYGRKTQSATLKKVGESELESNKLTIYSTDLGGVVQGTWLGLSFRASDKTIKIGNLANVTGEEHHGKIGRGPIVTDFITSDDSIEACNKVLTSACEDYSSFNLLSVEIKGDDLKTFYVSNSPRTCHELPRGFVGLGNSPLKKPFKKVEAGTAEFEKVLNSHKNSNKEKLVDALMTILMNDTEFFPDDELTARNTTTARLFSSIHVEIPHEDYGTRTRTVILVDDEGNVDYVEDTMTSLDPRGEWARTHLTIPKKDL